MNEGEDDEDGVLAGVRASICMNDEEEEDEKEMKTFLILLGGDVCLLRSF